MTLKWILQHAPFCGKQPEVRPYTIEHERIAIVLQEDFSELAALQHRLCMSRHGKAVGAISLYEAVICALRDLYSVHLKRNPEVLILYADQPAEDKICQAWPRQQDAVYLQAAVSCGTRALACGDAEP